ncbi:MAG: cyclic nucleotide-binding domain-containing protein [Spirochaetota bacterium]|nr:cyclic nucleotide-binding domain-containing protein [Spirochaetota bacterium]
MTDTDNYIYRQQDSPDFGYRLRKGEIAIELDNETLFNLKASTLFGIPELLLSEEDGHCPRLFSVKSHSDNILETIHYDQIRVDICHYDTGFHIGKHIAELLILLDNILIHKMDQQSERQKLSNRYCKVFYRLVDQLGAYYNDLKFPWLEELYKGGLSSITYTKGKALYSTFSTEVQSATNNHFKQLDSYVKEYPPGTYICREGESGNELYILKQGRLQVVIKDHKISEISRSGAIVGDMIFWLGGDRTASLKTIEKTSMVVIHKSDLQKIMSVDHKFLKTLAINLSRRVLRHCVAIERINREIEEGAPSTLKEKDELKDLKNTLSVLSVEHSDLDWLHDMYQAIHTEFEKLEESDHSR